MITTSRVDKYNTNLELELLEKSLATTETVGQRSGKTSVLLQYQFKSDFVVNPMQACPHNMASSPFQPVSLFTDAVRF